MRRIDVYIHENQYNFLTIQSGTISEIIRRAIDDYIEKTRTLKVSASTSKKGGDTNG